MFGSTERRCVAVISVFLITVVLVVGMAGCDGNPSQGPEIRTWYDLDAVRDNLAGSFILMNDLDSTAAGYEELASPTANGGKGWRPLGQLIGGHGPIFAGTFDGQGHEIRDLFISRPDEDGVGLFGEVGQEGVIENIGVVNVIVTGRGSVGALAAGVQGNLNRSHSSGSVTGDWYVGGLVGSSWEATLSNSYSTANVAGNSIVGGLVGWNGASVSNSYVTGNVSGGDIVGGLLGWNEAASVSNCYSTGSAAGNSSVGGLVGISANSAVNNSYSTGSVTGERGVGGLVGEHVGGTVSNSYYNYDEVLVNGQNLITIGALSSEDFDQWLASDKSLDVNSRLSQEDGYYLINDVSDFKELLPFGQNTPLKFRLTSDLDLTTEPNFYIPYLGGEFDGNGHRISNLNFNSNFVSEVGLFGYLAPAANLTGLAAENVNVTGDTFVGSLVGDNYGAISKSRSTGSATGSHCVGGLVGYNRGTVSDSHSTSSVTGGNFVGGLVGISDTAGAVTSCYSTGSVGGNLHVGGLMGSGTASISFWDIQTSGQTTSAGGTAQNTTEMKTALTFSNAGWDMIPVSLNETNPAYIWNIVNNVTYPFLSWQS